MEPFQCKQVFFQRLQGKTIQIGVGQAVRTDGPQAAVQIAEPDQVPCDQIQHTRHRLITFQIQAALFKLVLDDGLQHGHRAVHGTVGKLRPLFIVDSDLTEPRHLLPQARHLLPEAIIPGKTLWQRQHPVNGRQRLAGYRLLFVARIRLATNIGYHPHITLLFQQALDPHQLRNQREPFSLPLCILNLDGGIAHHDCAEDQQRYVEQQTDDNELLGETNP